MTREGMHRQPCSRCHKPALTPRALTAQERRWQKRLAAVLASVPPGIGLFTAGDRSLTLYDRAAAEAHGIEHLEDGGAAAHGLELGFVRSAVPIEGVS